MNRTKLITEIMIFWSLFIIVLMGLFCVYSKSSIISTVVSPTAEIIELLVDKHPLFL